MVFSAACFALRCHIHFILWAVFLVGVRIVENIDLACLIAISCSLISEFTETERAKEEVGAASTKKGKCSLKEKI